VSVFSFLAEAYGELQKVKWPSRKEMVSYTIVVIVLCTIMTVYFYLIDMGISSLLRAVFQ
jgi:preprotein translocase subunit SecE